MRKLSLLALIGLIVLAACSTGDSRTDSLAAQQFMPQVAGYETQNADSIADAVAASGAAGSAAMGNFLGSAAVLKLNDVIQCYQDVGALSALIYLPQSVGDGIPAIGIVAVINNTRIERNLGPCLLGTADREIGAQGVVEICSADGNFVVQEEQFSYLYAATQPNLCNQFATHFAQYE